MSFGGGIALSAGSSQGSNAGLGMGGSSQANACEISSDDGDVNGKNHSCEDEDHGSSPLDKSARGGPATANPRGAAAGKTPGKAPSIASKPHQADSGSGRSGRGRNEPDRSEGPREKTGTRGIAGKPPADTTRGNRRGKTSRSSLEAFDRIISGQDYCLESPPSPPTGNGPASREAGGGGERGSGGGARESWGGASGDKGDGDDSDDCCEIMFTRVSRPASTSSSSAQERPRQGSPVIGKEAGRAWDRARARTGSSRGTGVLSDMSDLSERDERSADGERD